MTTTERTRCKHDRHTIMWRCLACEKIAYTCGCPAKPIPLEQICESCKRRRVN